MALCSNCGREMGQGIYCGGCGQRTGGSGNATTSTPPNQWSQPQQYAQPQQQFYPGPQSARTNPMAITAFVLCFVCGFILPVVFGHIALNQINRTGEGGRGLAIAALVIGYVQMAIWGLIFIAAVGAGSSGY